MNTEIYPLAARESTGSLRHRLSGIEQVEKNRQAGNIKKTRLQAGFFKGIFISYIIRSCCRRSHTLNHPSTECWKKWQNLIEGLHQ
jgi:hypothetical protein